MSVDLVSLGEALYGGTSQSAPQQRPPAPPPSQQPVQQQRLPDLPTSDSDMAESLYGRRPMEETSAERSIASIARERAGFEPAEAAAIAEKWGGALHYYQVNSTDAEVLIEVASGVMSGSVEFDPTQGAIDARRELKIEFGESAEKALELARRMIAKDDVLSRWLATTGLGSHPRFVLAAARRAWDQRHREL